MGTFDLDAPTTAAADGLADALLVRLRAAANPTRAEGEARYLKSARPFIGVDVPTTRRIVRSLVCATPTPVPSTSIGAAVVLWGRPEFDCRRTAAEVLCAVAKRGELDLVDLARIEPMIADGESWAIVDVLAIGVAGVILHADRSPAADELLVRWSRSPEMWVRRASLISLLPSLRADLDRWDRFVEVADRLLGEREFFIRKAIGWVARDVGRRHPDVVVDWARPRLAAMSGVTRREVVRRLPELG